MGEYSLPTDDEKKEQIGGWGGAVGSQKWHFYEPDGRSLCRRYMFLGPKSNLLWGNDNSPDNCKECSKKRVAQKQKG